MNGSQVPNLDLGVASLGPRAVAHLVAGLQVLAAFVLLFEVVLDLSFPGLRAVFKADQWVTLLPAVTAHLVAAYILGVVTDGIAHRLWRWIARDEDQVPPQKEWLRDRTNLDKYPDLQTERQPWLDAQYWFWTSSHAASEAGDLRTRLMLGQSSALAIFLAVGFCAFGLIYVPLCAAEYLPETFSCPVSGASSSDFSGLYWIVLASASLLYSRWATYSLYRVMTKQTSPEESLTPFLLYSGLYLALFFALRWCVGWEVGPVSYWWLAGGTAFGPFLGFGMLYVRLDANKHYHRLVLDASDTTPPADRP